MAANNVNALVENFNTSANLNLTGEQVQQLQQLLTGAAERSAARREAGQQVVQQLQAAVQNNDNAATEQLLVQLREGFRQVAQGRENFLDQFDQVLQPEQRARLFLSLVQQARDSGRTVEQLVDNLLTQGGQNN